MIKADLVLHLIDTQFDLLRSMDAFFFGDEVLSRSELMTKYGQFRKDAERFQLNMAD